MGLGEIAIIILLAVLVFEPSDYKRVVKFLVNLTKRIDTTKKDIELEIEKIISSNDEMHDLSSLDAEEINFYLNKIISLDHNYKGEYNLKKIRAYYHSLVSKTEKQK
ncbi:MAG: DUF2672 domain-containing protein [Rickettsiaceae bacterium]|nr:DUF2672 domain-containing protein [Rickettsiaceae bacterium]